MSWSVSAAARRDEAIQQIREQFARCTYLPPGEGGRGDRMLGEIEHFAQASVEPTDVLKISAWGSESIVHGPTSEPPRIISIQGGYSVAVERPPVATELPIRSEVGAGG